MFQGPKGELNRIAELHYFYRSILSEGLKTRTITQEGKGIVGNFNTYYDYWIAAHGDRFFDMGTIIRLGSTIESILRNYYMSKVGHKSLLDLRSDQDYRRGIFQRIHPWSGNDTAIALFGRRLGVNLEGVARFKGVQELMLHRHLYAHNCGLLDDEYLGRLKQLTGIDLMGDQGISATYPAQDTYYFSPLNRLNDFIEQSREFVHNLTS